MSKRKKDWKDIKIPKEVPPEALNGTGNKFMMDENGLYSIQVPKVFSIFGEEYNNEVNKEMEQQFKKNNPENGN